jgi:lipopolysaccharide transport system ATP-binding protein
MLELGVGFAPNLTVRQNIQIHGRLAGIPARQVRAAEAAILDFSGLTAHADSLLGACPGGSAVQLGFAAVMCLGAEIVLADEVLAVGDADFRRTCEDKVREAGRAGGSVLFVSHDMAAIRRICTRVIWIDRGRIVRDGPAEDVVLAYMTELLQGRLLSPLTREGLAGSCTLLDLRLLDRNHSQVGALQVTEPGYIDCLFRVTRPDVAITVTIELRCGKQSVFTTTSAPVTTREAQTFRAGVLVPADLLNELPYAAVVTLHAHALDERPAVAGEDRLEFSAMNPHPERSVWRDWAWGRGGVISPRLPWSVEALGVHETPSAGAVPGAPA